MLFEGAKRTRHPPDVGDTISRLDNLARFQEASLQDYFRLLNDANVGSTARYTVVLWTGPSGRAKAEEIAEDDARVMAAGSNVRPTGVYFTGSNTCYSAFKF